MAARPRVKPTGPRIGGLPAYTKEQFAQIRPNGQYANYLSYIKRARGITGTGKPPYPGRGGPGLPTYMSLLKGLSGLAESPAQIEARARRMAGQDYKFAQQQAELAYKRQQDDAMRRMLAFQSAGRAAAGMNASLIGQVGGQYQAGADALSTMAASGAAQMAGATDAAVASANQATSNVGMPGVTQGGPVGAPGLAGPQQAGVESYRGGTLPAQALTNAGGFASAGMAGTIGAQNLRATQEAQAAYMSAMEQAQGTRGDALATALAGRKSDMGDYLLKLQDSQRQQIALAMSLIEGRRNSLQTGFEQKITKKTLAQKTAADKRDYKLAVSKMKADAVKQNVEWSRIDASASRAAGYLIDKAGRPVLGKNGQPIPVAASASGSSGGLTANQQQRQIEKAQSLAETLFYGYKTDKNGKRIPANESGDFDPNDASTYGTGNASYQTAMTRLLQLHVSPKQAQAILNQYYERGDSGRPVFSAPEKRSIVAGLMKKWKTTKPKAQKAFAISLKGIQDAFASGNVAEGERLIQALLASA